MEYKEMKEADIAQAVELYINYYNTCEDSQWTKETATRRIHQVVSMEGSYCLAVMEGEKMLAFVMGYYEQFDDLVAYELNEIVVAKDAQNQGIGSMLMREIEHRVKENGAMLIQLDAVKDEHHEHFYSKLGYGTATNFVVKCKMI